MPSVLRCSFVFAILSAPLLSQQTSEDYQRQIDEKRAERIVLESQVESLGRELSQARQSREASLEAKVSQAKSEAAAVQVKLRAIQDVIDEHTYRCDVVKTGKGDIAGHRKLLLDSNNEKRTLTTQLTLARSNIDFLAGQKGWKSPNENRLESEMQLVQGDIRSIGAAIQSAESLKKIAIAAEEANKKLKEALDREKQERADRQRREAIESQEARDAELRREERRANEEKDARRRESENGNQGVKASDAPEAALPDERSAITPIPWSRVGLSAKSPTETRAPSDPRSRRAEDIFLRPRAGTGQSSSSDSRPVGEGRTAPGTSTSPNGVPSESSQLTRRAGDALVAAQDSARSLVVDVLASAADRLPLVAPGGELKAGTGAIVRGSAEAYLEAKWSVRTRDMLAHTLYGLPHDSLSETQRNDMANREAARAMIALPGESHSAATRYWDEHVSKRINQAIDDLMGGIGK